MTADHEIAGNVDRSQQIPNNSQCVVVQRVHGIAWKNREIDTLIFQTLQVPESQLLGERVEPFRAGW